MSSLTVTDSNVVTSTPVMKSEMGRKLLLQNFVLNIAEISLSADYSPKVKPFIFKKEEVDSPKLAFHAPPSISPETIEKFNKLFHKSPKHKVKRIRL